MVYYWCSIVTSSLNAPFLRYSLQIMWPWNPGQRSLKVIRTDTDRSASYDLLLTLHIYNAPISYRFRDKRRFHTKIANFFPSPCTLLLRWRELGIGAWGQKIPEYRVMGLLSRTKRLTISSAMCIIQMHHVTDRWTDTGRQQRLRLRITSRA